MSSADPLFDKNIPGQRDPYAQWQIDLQNNFSILNDFFAQNHVGFYSDTQPSSTDQGKHTYVQLNSATDPQTANNENNLYTKLDVKNAAQLFMAMQNNTANFQFSAWQATKDLVANQFNTSLPGNFVINFGVSDYKSPMTTLPIKSSTKEIVYATAVNENTISVGSNVDYFIVQLGENEGKNYLNVIWNSTLNVTVPPKRFFYLYIEKLNDV